MKTYLGEDGTEQFTVTTRVNGELIREQKVHDPFAHTRVILKGWGHAWRALFGGIKVSVCIGGTPGAERAVMMLDPEQLQKDTKEFLRERADSRAVNSAQGIVGYYHEPA